MYLLNYEETFVAKLVNHPVDCRGNNKNRTLAAPYIDWQQVGYKNNYILRKNEDNDKDISKQNMVLEYNSRGTEGTSNGKLTKQSHSK